jgi:hypothetical protein
VNRTVQSLVRGCTAQPRFCRDGALAVFGVFAKTTQNK